MAGPLTFRCGWLSDDSCWGFTWGAGYSRVWGECLPVNALAYVAGGSRGPPGSRLLSRPRAVVAASCEYARCRGHPVATLGFLGVIAVAIYLRGATTRRGALSLSGGGPVHRPYCPLSLTVARPLSVPGRAPRASCRCVHRHRSHVGGVWPVVGHPPPLGSFGMPPAFASPALVGARCPLRHSLRCLPSIAGGGLTTAFDSRGLVVVVRRCRPSCPRPLPCSVAPVTVPFPGTGDTR